MGILAFFMACNIDDATSIMALKGIRKTDTLMVQTNIGSS